MGAIQVVLVCSIFLFLPFDLHSFSDNNVQASIDRSLPPRATVGPDQTVNENTTVTLFGNASDPDPGHQDTLRFEWDQIEGPIVSLLGTNTTTPVFVAPEVSSDTVLKFSFTAIDDKGVVSSITPIVTVTVKDTVPSNIKVQTDKPSYTPDERINIYATVKQVIPGNILRMDVYDPSGEILWDDLHIMRTLGTENSFGSIDGRPQSGITEPGEYSILVTYGNQTGRTTFSIAPSIG